MLRRIYTNTPLLEALRKTPAYLQSLRELASKKEKHGGPSVIPIAEVCSLILQNQSPSKLQDPGSLFISCAIGDLQIEGAFCDLGASMSLILFSLYRRRPLQDVQPTSLIIQRVDRSIKRPAGILENILVQVG